MWSVTTPLDDVSLRCQLRLEQLGLTLAEQRVALLVLAGWSNKAIGRELGRAEPTVKNQVASVLRKSQRPSRAEFIAEVYGEVLRGVLGRSDGGMAARVPQEAQPVTLR